MAVKTVSETLCSNIIFAVVVLQKLKILSSFAHSLVFSNMYDFLFSEANKEDISKDVGNRTTAVGFVYIQKKGMVPPLFS